MFGGRRTQGVNGRGGGGAWRPRVHRRRTRQASELAGVARGLVAWSASSGARAATHGRGLCAHRCARPERPAPAGARSNRRSWEPYFSYRHTRPRSARPRAGPAQRFQRRERAPPPRCRNRRAATARPGADLQATTRASVGDSGGARLYATAGAGSRTRSTGATVKPQGRGAVVVEPSAPSSQASKLGGALGEYARGRSMPLCAPTRERLAIHSAAGRSAPGPKGLERRLRTTSGDAR